MKFYCHDCSSYFDSTDRSNRDAPPQSPQVLCQVCQGEFVEIVDDDSRTTDTVQPADSTPPTENTYLNSSASATGGSPPAIFSAISSPSAGAFVFPFAHLGIVSPPSSSSNLQNIHTTGFRPAVCVIQTLTPGTQSANDPSATSNTPQLANPQSAPSSTPANTSSPWVSSILRQVLPAVHNILSTITTNHQYHTDNNSAASRPPEASGTDTASVSPSLPHGNGSERRRPRSNDDHPQERDQRLRSDNQPIQDSETITDPPSSPASPASRPLPFIATFVQQMSQDQEMSIDTIRNLLLNGFSEMMYVAQTANQHLPVNGGMNNPSDNYNGDSSRNEDGDPSSLDPARISDLLREALLQAFSSQVSSQDTTPAAWIRLHVPDVIGDYVFGEQAFDQVLSNLMDQAAQQRAPPPASPDVIAALPRQPYNPSDLPDLQNQQENPSHADTCTVCREAFGQNTTLVVLGCRHFFHEECIVSWLTLNGTCPVCRQEVGQKQEANPNEA